MRLPFRIALAAALIAAPLAAAAQAVSGGGSGITAPVNATHPLPVGGFQESLALVAGNTAAGSVKVYGGDYVFAQTCSAYGTVALQVRGPDGATMQTVLSKAAADTAGGTGVALGSGSWVQVALTGTTGCNATLARVP